jgi:carboxymethylenebutenolidase
MSVIPEICPVVASFGGRDARYGKNGPALEAALEEAGVPHDVKTYPDAGHSFMSRHEGLVPALMARGPMRLGHDAEASEDAWARVLAFFGEHLAARSAEPAALDPTVPTVD